MEDLFNIQGNSHGKLTTEDLPQIKEIKSLIYEKANDFYENSILSSEKKVKQPVNMLKKKEIQII